MKELFLLILFGLLMLLSLIVMGYMIVLSFSYQNISTINGLSIFTIMLAIFSFSMFAFIYVAKDKLS